MKPAGEAEAGVVGVGPLPKTTWRRGSQTQSISVRLTAYCWSLASASQQRMKKLQNMTEKTHLTVGGLNGLNDLWPYGPTYSVCCCHTLKKGWFIFASFFFEALFEWANKRGQLYPASVFVN